MTDSKEKLTKRLLVIGLIVLLVEVCLVVAILLYLSAQPHNDAVGQMQEKSTKHTGHVSMVLTVPPITPNRFKPEDFAYNSQGYLTCVTEECLMGIDVSSYQTDIDWRQVKAAGFDFVMIRVGGRSYGGSGKLYEDDMCESHYRGAKEAGLLVGAYMFSQAVNTQEAAEEAYFALNQIVAWELDLPLVYDWEYIDDEKRTAFIYEDVVTECVKTFCEIVENCGEEPMVYVSPWFGRMKLEELKDYPQWVARYTDQMDYAYHFDMWQYTCSGKVPGIAGPVDINIYFPPK